ncbi:MAG: PQQ-dependent sugar dehydrogenase [Pseudomonadota bacterium]
MRAIRHRCPAKRSRPRVLATAGLAAALLAAPAVQANTLFLERANPTNLSNTVDIVAVPGTDSAVFLLNAFTGAVRVLDRSDPDAPVLTTAIPNGQVLGDAGALQALSLAPAPDFQSSGHLYVSAAANGGAADQTGNVVLRYTLDPATLLLDGAAPQAELIARIAYPDEAERSGHVGGAIRFVSGGQMILTTGDGADGSAGPGDDLMLVEPSIFIAGDPGNPLGSVFRFVPSAATPFEVEADMTLAGGGDAADFRVAQGFRNPFKADFVAESNELIVGDVGQDRFEEVNRIDLDAPGAPFYGWPRLEGEASFDPAAGTPAPPGGAVDPYFVYSHTDFAGSGASPPPFQGDAITGGTVYRGPLSALTGQYVFADFERGDGAPQTVRSLTVTPDGSAPEATSWMIQLAAAGDGLTNALAFGADGAGTLYIADLSDDIFVVTEASTIIPLPASGALSLGLVLGIAAVGRYAGRRTARAAAVRA